MGIRRRNLEERVRELEAELAHVRASADQWHLLCTHAPDYLSIVDRNLFCRWVNRVHPSRTVQDVIGSNLAELVSPETATVAADCIARVLATGDPDNYLERARIGDAELWHETRVIPVDVSNGLVLLASRDVTEQHRAEVTAREMDRTTRVLIDACTDSVLLLEPNGVVVAANETAARFLGAPRDLLIGKDVCAFMDPRVAAGRAERMADVVRQKRAVSHEDEQDGRVFDCSFAPVFGAAGEVARIAVYARDVTEKLELQNVLRDRAARRSHADKLEALGTLASGIAHDFNNVLTPIVACASLAARPGIPESARAGHLDTIRTAATRATRLIRQILSYGRHGLVETALTDVAGVVEDAVTLMRASLPVNIRIEVLQPEPVARVLADASRLHQAVTNLCINAGHAMAESGGQLTVALAEQRIEAGAVSGVEAGHYATIRVRDTGPGIAPDILDRIFDPFYSTKPSDEGTGLGLFVVHGVATSHRGAVTVESELGKGAAFTLWIPIAEQPVRSTERLELEREPARPLSLLVVDDEPAILGPLSGLLALEGHEAHTFGDSESAAKAFASDPDRFGGAILDQHLVRRSGLELARLLRSTRPGLPIILSSGNLSEAERAAAERLGVVILNKPYTPDQLYAAIAGSQTPGVVVADR